MNWIEKFMKEIDRNVAIIGIVTSFILIFTLYFTINRYVDVPFFIFMACSFYLLIKNKISGDFSIFEQTKTLSRTSLNSLFFILLIDTIVSFIARPNYYTRPVIFFILIVFLAVLILIEILFTETSNLVLVKIALLALVLRWFPQLMFSGPVGIVDPWLHKRFTEDILSSSHIPDNFPYSKLPVMHLIVASTSLLTGLDYKFSAMSSIDILQIISIIFIFMLGKFVFNSKIGLLSALIIAISDRYIQIGFWIIPQTLGMILITILIYLIFICNRNSMYGKSLVILTSIILIMTHTVTSLAMSIFFIISIISYIIFGKFYKKISYKPIDFTLFSFFTITMISWWMYISGHFYNLIELLRWGLKFDQWSALPAATEYSQTIPFLEKLANTLGFLLFYFFSLIGTLYVISLKNRNEKLFSLTMSGNFFATIAFLSLPLGLTGILSTRWFFISQLILAIPAAIGLFSMLNLNIKYNNLFIIILFAIFTFFMITNPTSNIDTPLYSQNSLVRLGFTKEEIISANTLLNIADISNVTNISRMANFMDISHMGVANVVSDVGYMATFGLSVGTGTKDIAYFMYTNNYSELIGTSLFVIRKEIETKPFYAKGTLKFNFDLQKKFSEHHLSKIYDSTTVTAYIVLD